MFVYVDIVEKDAGAVITGSVLIYGVSETVTFWFSGNICSVRPSMFTTCTGTVPPMVSI